MMDLYMYFLTHFPPSFFKRKLASQYQHFCQFFQRLYVPQEIYYINANTYSINLKKGQIK